VSLFVLAGGGGAEGGGGGGRRGVARAPPSPPAPIRCRILRRHRPGRTRLPRHPPSVGGAGALAGRGPGRGGGRRDIRRGFGASSRRVFPPCCFFVVARPLARCSLSLRVDIRLARAGRAGRAGTAASRPAPNPHGRHGTSATQAGVNRARATAAPAGRAPPGKGGAARCGEGERALPPLLASHPSLSPPPPPLSPLAPPARIVPLTARMRLSSESKVMNA
jgi:hypothetical protein